MMDPNSSKHCINYHVLFSKQGIALTQADVEETKKSTSRALKVLAKHLMIKSIIKSQRIIPNKAV